MLYSSKERNLSQHYYADYSSDDVMSSEVLEDIFYVQLNLLLANRICIHLMNNNYINSENKCDSVAFIKDIQNCINMHISEYSDSYSLLQDIREYKIKKLDIKSAEFIYNNIIKDEINIKNYKMSLIKKILG